MTFLSLFKKKEQAPPMKIMQPMPFGDDSVKTEQLAQPTPEAPAPKPTPSPNNAATLQAEDEEALTLGQQQSAPVPPTSQPTQQVEQPVQPSTPAPTQERAAPRPASVPPTPVPLNSQPTQQVEHPSQSAPVQIPAQANAMKTEINEMRDMEKNALPDIVAYPGKPGSGKIFEGIYVRKERYLELLGSLRENREGLQSLLSDGERLLQLQKKIVHNLEKEESLLNTLFEKVMTIELLTKRC